MRSKFRVSTAALNRRADPPFVPRTVPPSPFRLKRQAWCVARPVPERHPSEQSFAAETMGLPPERPAKMHPDVSSRIGLAPPRDLYSELLLANGLCLSCKAAPAGSAGVCICCYMVDVADEAH
jgi:hypothetical protein